MSDCCRISHINLPTAEQLLPVAGDCGDEICIPSVLNPSFVAGSIVQREVCAEVGGSKTKAWAVLMLGGAGSSLLRVEDGAGNEIQGAVIDNCPCEAGCSALLNSCCKFHGWDYLDGSAWSFGEYMHFDIVVDGVIKATILCDYAMLGLDYPTKSYWYQPVIDYINNQVNGWSIELVTDVDKTNDGDQPIWKLSTTTGQELQIQKYGDGHYAQRDRLIFTPNANGTITVDSDDAMTGSPYGTPPSEGNCDVAPPVGPVQGCIIGQAFDGTPAEILGENRQYGLRVNGVMQDQMMVNHNDYFDGIHYSTMYTPIIEAFNNLANWNIEVYQDSENPNIHKVQWRVTYGGPGNETVDIFYKGLPGNASAERWTITVDGAGNMTSDSFMDNTGTSVGSNWYSNC